MEQGKGKVRARRQHGEKGGVYELRRDDPGNKSMSDTFFGTS